MWSRVVLACLSIVLCAEAHADEPAPSFKENVAPILVRQCLGCHNAEKAENGLDMSTFARLKSGGKAGEAFISGNSADSELILSVLDDASPRMPYKLPPLSPSEIDILKRWVDGGAKFDGESEAETRLASLYDPLKNLPVVPSTANVLEPVNSIAFSPDGSILAAAIGREVVLYEVGTGKERARLAADLGIVNVVRFTKDGATLIAAGGRAGMFGAVGGWTVATSAKSFEVKGHADAILAADVSPDGKTLATAGYDRLIFLWDLAPTPKVRLTLKDHTDAVFALAFRDDGAMLASAGADRTVKLWNPSDGERIKTLSDSKAELLAVSFGVDPQTVIAGGVDRTLRVWRIADREATIENSAFAHEGSILNLALIPSTRRIVSGGEDRSLKLWDLGDLRLRNSIPDQSDWPQSIAVDSKGQTLAVGRADGTLTLLNLETSKPILELRTKPAQPTIAEAPKFTRPATLNPPSPRGGSIGTKLRLTLTGEGVGEAVAAIFPEADLAAEIIHVSPPDPNRVEVDLTIGEKARVGLHSFGLRTPRGTTGFQVFAVDAAPAVAEVEPNSSLETAQKVASPTTLVGTIDHPGDRDFFRFAVYEKEPITLVATTKSLGSSLSAVLTLRDEQGRILAESTPGADTADPTLTALAPIGGFVTLEVKDADFGGSPAHIYRLAIGREAVFSSFRPLGIAMTGTTEVKVEGFGIGEIQTVKVQAAAGAKPGSPVEVPVVLSEGSRPLQRKAAVVVEGPQIQEAVSNDSPSDAQSVAVPSGVSGTIEHDGDLDHFRFEAKKGERLIVEVYGRRLGSLVDPALEILDSEGRPLPRAVLRPLSATEVAFRDHNATGRGIRLTHWENLTVNDVVLIGRELTTVASLPRNPDDDCLFRTEAGQRAGRLETTPEYHPMGEQIYKVEVLEPNAKLDDGGMKPVTLYYRNDDGGPSFQKDARLTFDPPADGSYLIRVDDARGLGDPRFDYHLVIRKPSPDFRINLSTENPNITRGGTTLVEATVERLDGFEGPIDLRVEHLPAGITATSARIERETNSTLLSLHADSSAPAYGAPTWTVVATAEPGLEHTVDPGGPDRGWITVAPEPNFEIVVVPSRVKIHPGEDLTLTLKVNRGIGYAGRIPVDVVNLPQGVRVLNIGLNGVLVREGESERTITLHAEPWVKAMERPFFAVGKAEAVATEHSSTAATLVVEPSEQAAAESTKFR